MSPCCRYAPKRCRYWSYGRIACDSAPKKLPYHTPRAARSIGKFDRKGALRKWLSISCAPVRNSMKFSHPMASAIDVPIADHEE
jgi:hypothetical protein